MEATQLLHNPGLIAYGRGSIFGPKLLNDNMNRNYEHAPVIIHGKGWLVAPPKTTFFL